MHDHTLAKATAFDLAAHRASDPSSMPSRSLLPDTLVVRRPRDLLVEGDAPAHWRTRLQDLPGTRETGRTFFCALEIAAPTDRIMCYRGLRAEFYRPRNVAWTDYPILSDTLYSAHGLDRPSRHEHHLTLEGSFRSSMPIRSVSFQEIRDRAERVVLVPSGMPGDDEWARMAMDVVRRDLRTDMPFVDERGAPYPAVDRSTAHARFAYSYRINMLGIGLQVLGHGVDVPGRTSSVANRAEEARSTPILDADRPLRDGIDALEGVLDPLSVQLLAAIHDAVDGDRRDAVAFDDLPFARVGRDWIWSGTGRHPGVRLDTVRMGRVLKAAIRYDWLSYDYEAQGYRLTDTGRIVAARIPKAMRDGDVLCRWADAPDDMETRRSMDAWVVRSFRALKRVANDLRREGN